MTTPAYPTLSRAMPEPMPGRPVDLPILTDSGNAARRVRVHTELGIPVYFDPTDGQFSARVGSSVQGRGESSELHSGDFSMLVERIRKRALVVPVQGYLVSIDHRATTDEALVQVRPCTVIEHHAKRYQPFVVRVAEQSARHRSDRNDEPLPMVERIRATSDVLLPEPDHIERVRAAHKAVLEEERRHEEAKRHLMVEVHEAMAAIPRLTARDLKYVQESGRQVAQPPEAVGALVYDTTDDDEEEAGCN